MLDMTAGVDVACIALRLGAEQARKAGCFDQVARASLSKLDNYRFTVSEVRAFKCSRVVSVFIARHLLCSC
jgi:hypothetical protein